MKNLTPALQAHIQRATTTLATCWRLMRTDGVEFGFTDHDRHITVDGLVYRADTGYVPTAVDSSANLAVDNLEVEGMLDDARLTDTELAAGLYDYAHCEVFMVNWAIPADGKIPVKSGKLAEVSRTRIGFAAEVRGVSQAMQQSVGEVLTPTCRADLGDARCAVDIAALTVTGTITSVASRRKFAVGARTEADGYFSYGLLAWTSGENAGRRQEIKSFTAATGEFELLLQASYDVAPGDEFTVYPGCDKRWPTCHAKFANTVNFRGEPFIPGQDEILKLGSL